MSPFALKKRKEPAAETAALRPVSRGESAGPRPLTTYCSDIFSLVLSLKQARDLGDVGEFRKRIHRMLEVMEEEARKSGYGSVAVEDARFAVVACLDEAVLNSPWSGKDAWRSNPLQAEIFKINVAGEEFFTRLDKLRANLDENRPVVEVYYDCLALGFEGRFKLFGREKLDALINDLSRELARGQGWNVDSLSPRWKRPDDFTEAVGEGVPMWVTALFFIPGAILLIALFAAVAHSSAGSTAETIRHLMAGLGR